MKERSERSDCSDCSAIVLENVLFLYNSNIKSILQGFGMFGMFWNILKYLDLVWKFFKFLGLFWKVFGNFEISIIVWNFGSFLELFEIV